LFMPMTHLFTTVVEPTMVSAILLTRYPQRINTSLRKRSHQLEGALIITALGFDLRNPEDLKDGENEIDWYRLKDEPERSFGVLVPTILKTTLS